MSIEKKNYTPNPKFDAMAANAMAIEQLILSYEKKFEKKEYKIRILK